jgi:hypothetical protein
VDANGAIISNDDTSLSSDEAVVLVSFVVASILLSPTATVVVAAVGGIATTGIVPLPFEEEAASIPLIDDDMAPAEDIADVGDGNGAVSDWLVVVVVADDGDGNGGVADDEAAAAVTIVGGTTGAGGLLTVGYSFNPSNLMTPCPNISSAPVPTTRAFRLPTIRTKKYIFSNANHDDEPTTGFNTGVSSFAHRATDDCESIPFNSVVIVAGGVRLPRDVSANAEPKNVTYT